MSEERFPAAPRGRNKSMAREGWDRSGHGGAVGGEHGGESIRMTTRRLDIAGPLGNPDTAAPVRLPPGADWRRCGCPRFFVALSSLTPMKGLHCAHTMCTNLGE